MSNYPAEQTVWQYMGHVANGQIPACKWLKLAVDRQMNDLESGEERGLWFDPDAGQLVVDFFGLLKHSKGEWAGQPVVLEPWQQFVLWVLFGWKRADGSRRFRNAYLEIARKNGKSTVAAGVGLYLMVADGEAGAEIYSAATKRDQARITHSEATRMVKASPALRKRIKVFRDNLNIEDTASKYEPLGRDSDSMDGLNVHGVIIDELHAHKTREVVDVLETAKSARRQPMQFEITTAGFDRNSVCFEHHEYTEKVLSGIIQDDTWFGVIFSIDEEDDYADEKAWLKANPNLGISKKIDYMRDQLAKAQEMPSSLNAFLRLELDVWTQSETKWVPREHWDACGTPVEAEELRGRICYGGLDLSSNIDVTAFVMVFPPEREGEPFKILPRFWIPQESIIERSRKDRVPYDAWERLGYLTATAGNLVDYEFIMAQIDEDMQQFDLREIAFDRWGAARIQTQLADLGGEEFLVQFGQGVASMSPPMKELETLIMGHRLAHGGNPVLSWMADNLVARIDAAGNIKPDKERSREKIDGMVALIMALDRALRHAGDGRSVYEERGILAL